MNIPNFASLNHCGVGQESKEFQLVHIPTVQHHGTSNRYYNTTYHCLIDAEFGIYILYDSINVIFKIQIGPGQYKWNTQYPYRKLMHSLW